MNTSFFKNKKITVMGIGLHGGGVGVITFLATQGAKVIATDLKTKEQLAKSLEKMKGLKNVQYVLGQHRSEDFTNVDMVIKSPPVPWTDKYIQIALKNKVPVEMDSSLFFKMCKNPIIGVTGTKGKTTTSTIIYDLLKASGKHVIKVGIGQTSVLDKIAKLRKDTVVVFELSSWRCSALGRVKISPQIAVFKNILPDHLNYYKTMENYLKDKKYIYENQKPKDWFVVNADDNTLSALAKEAPSQVLRFSYEKLKEGEGIFIDNETIFIGDREDAQKIIDVEDVQIPGRHNLSNVMAALGAVYAFGLTPAQIKKAMKSVTGVAHRLEFVREIVGVRYYNDTAATIPDAAISALESFSQPIILIAGGNDKNLEFKDFGKAIAEKVKSVVLLKGNATEKLIGEIKKNGLELSEKSIVDSMEKAVITAKELSEKGDVVLLSPGAASFGLFLNEFDRGDQFRDIVNKLK